MIFVFFIVFFILIKYSCTNILHRGSLYTFYLQIIVPFTFSTKLQLSHVDCNVAYSIFFSEKWFPMVGNCCVVSSCLHHKFTDHLYDIPTHILQDCCYGHFSDNFQISNDMHFFPCCLFWCIRVCIVKGLFGQLRQWLCLSFSLSSSLLLKEKLYLNREL